MIIDMETPILDKLLDPVTEVLTPSVAKAIAELQADPRIQARVDELASKSSSGRLTDAERRQFRDYVEAIDFLGILQAKACAVATRGTAHG